MALQHPHTILCIIPIGRRTAVRNFIVAAGIDSAGALWFPSELSADGQTPATYAMSQWQSNNINLRKWKTRICAMASITEPSNAVWDSWTRAEKKQWFLDQRNTIWANIGVWIEPMESEGVWSNPDAVLAGRSLQRIVTEV